MRQLDATRAASGVHIPGLAIMAVLSIPTIGCASISGEHDVEAKFLVDPRVDGSFHGWSEITISEDPNSVDHAKLGFVRLDAKEPAKDLTFLQSLRGEAVTETGRTLLVTKTGMPVGEPNVALDLVYEDDIRPFFNAERTVRVEWDGATNPAFTAWPDGGIWVTVTARILVE
jgi:hypothetical protein